MHAKIAIRAAPKTVDGAAVGDARTGTYYALLYELCKDCLNYTRVWSPVILAIYCPFAGFTWFLWNRCTAAAPPQTSTCDKIQEVNAFFQSNFRQCFPGKPLPATTDYLQVVYGWVQFPGCATPLVQSAGYDAAIRDYCDLQYNFFDPAVPATDVFNPYVKLIHQTLASNAYAFSIDDAVSFKSLPGTGIVITIAGVTGLENQTQTPLPTASTYETYCRGGSGPALGAASPGQFFKRLLDRYRVYVHLGAQPDWGVGRVRSTDGPLAKVRFANRGTVVVDTRHTRLNVVRLRPIPATQPQRD